MSDPAGAGPGSFRAKWKKKCVFVLGKHNMGSSALCSSLSPKLIFSLSCCLYILYYLPLTTNISKAHVLCLWALNSSAMTETLDFYVCLAEIYSSGREDSNCLLGDFTSTNSFHIHKGFLIKPKETNLHPGLQRHSKSRLQWQQPVYNLLGPFLFLFS